MWTKPCLCFVVSCFDQYILVPDKQCMKYKQDENHEKNKSFTTCSGNHLKMYHSQGFHYYFNVIPKGQLRYRTIGTDLELYFSKIFTIFLRLSLSTARSFYKSLWYLLTYLLLTYLLIYEQVIFCRCHSTLKLTKQKMSKINEIDV